MANEVRLIDANAMMVEVYDSDEKQGNDVWHTGDIEYLVMAQPTVDAVEVVHGRWEDIYNGRYANPRFRCSVCKTKALYVAVQTELGNWRDEQDLSNYCPNCGAKMDGDGNG